MPSAFNPNTIWQDGQAVDKALIRSTSTGLGRVKTEIGHGGFVNNPVTGSEATGTAALAAAHNAAVRHSEFKDATNQPDANVTYNETTHGFDAQLRFPTLTAQRDVIFPATQGQVGANVRILNRSTGGFSLRVRREDPSNPGTYSDTTVPPNYRMDVRKDATGPANWTNHGRFADGATVADVTNLNADNLTSGIVPNNRISESSVLQHINTAAITAAGAVVAANSVTASGGLRGDQANPSASRYYGTDGGGNPGFYTLPSGGTGGTPDLHAATHGSGGSDQVALSAAQLTSGSIANARVPASAVTQHQAALALTQSQITNLPALLTSLQNQIDALKIEELHGELPISATGSHIIARRSSFAQLVDRVSLFLPAGGGSLTCRVSRDSETITGMGAITVTENEVSASSTIDSPSAGHKLLGTDETLRLHIDTYDGTPKLLAFSFKMIRA